MLADQQPIPPQPSKPTDQVPPNQAASDQAASDQAASDQAASDQAASDQAPPDQAPPVAPEQTTPVPSALPHHKIHRTRVSGLWVATGSFAVVLLLLLIFILQNSQTVGISYLGAHGHLPLGVALLLAAVCGILLVAFAGTARILQLRSTARRHRRIDAAARSAGSAGSAGPAR